MMMRDVFANTIEELMKNDSKIVVLDADLAKADGTINIRKHFPGQGIEVGIAEQNMASIAAGLSSYGFKPYITTFTPFATRRICDQLAISVCYAKQNVKVIGTDPGISAELNGGTHMSVEDIGVIRSIPNIVIFEPVDATQFAKAIPVINDYYGCVYIRMFRKETPDIFGEGYQFDLFKADVIKEGKDVSIFVSGMMTADAIKAGEILAAENIDAEIINVHTIKPIDKETVCASVKKTGCAVTVENHNIVGGLRSAVLEAIEENPVPLKGVGIPDRFGEVGKMPYLRGVMGMNVEDIVAAAKTSIKLRENLRK